MFLEYQLDYPNKHCSDYGDTYPTTISRPQNTSMMAAFWKEMNESGVRVNPEFTSQFVGLFSKYIQLNLPTSLKVVIAV